MATLEEPDFTCPTIDETQKVLRKLSYCLVTPAYQGPVIAAHLRRLKALLEEIRDENRALRDWAHEQIGYHPHDDGATGDGV